MAGLYPVCTFMVLVSLVTVHTVSANRPIMETCSKINACSCRTESGLIIDLSPLNSGDILRPAFHDVSVVGPSTDRFSWNPCTPFCESHCQGAAVCQVSSRSQSLYYTAGKHSTSVFLLNHHIKGAVNVTGLAVVYTYTINSITRESIVRLICAENGYQDRLIPWGETPPHSTIYLFDLVSKYACPRKMTQTPPATTVMPTMPTCPDPWSTKSQPTPPTTPTSRSTTTTTRPQVTSRSTTVTPTRSPSTQPPAIAVIHLDKLLWIIVSLISALLLLILVFIIVLIVKLGNSSQPGTIMVPGYNKSVSSKVEMDNTKGLIKY